jgi:Do/DeqQ family serine protease
MKRLLIYSMTAALLATLLIPATPVKAQDRYSAMIAGSSMESPFVKVAEKLKPSVVYVEVIREREVRMPFHDFDPFRRFFGPQPERDSEPETRKVPSSGSGVIIDSEGLVLTNNHVVEDAIEITVNLADGIERQGTIVGTDPETDLALISIGEVPEDHVAPLGDSDKLQIGEWAIAMGNPLGLDWTLTVGVISAKGRANLNISGGGPTFQDFIQTDASINFGNSGGPLTNIHGEVIGINAAINTRAENIGFAIPINLAKEVVRQLRDAGEVKRGYLGMLPRELTRIMKEALDIDTDVKGVFVESVEPDTPAEEGGLEASDVIVEIDNEPVSDVNDFRFRIARHAPGDKLMLTVLREGKEKKLTFKLGDRADLLASSGRTPQSQRAPEAWMGLEVVSLDDPRVRGLELEVNRGVLVFSIQEDSPAEGKLRRGDVIAEVDKQEIDNLDDWRRVTSELNDIERAVLIKYHPQGREGTRFQALKK